MSLDPKMEHVELQEDAFSDIEQLSREQLRELQWTRLQRQVAYNFRNSPYYRRSMEAVGMRPEDLKSWEDHARVPSMDKHDHRAAQEESLARFGHPFGMLVCKPLEALVMLSGTSGTTGLPTFYTVTARDLTLYSRLMARKLRRIGLRPGDRVLHGFSLSMMVGGQPLLQTLMNYGACVVPIGAEVGSRRLLEFAKLVKPRAMVCTPSYAEYLAENCMEVLGRPIKDLGLELLMCGGEPGAGLPTVRARIEGAYGARLHDYTGVIHTFHGISCGAPDAWMHFTSEDYCVLELRDPDTRKPIPVQDGAIGEMLYTELGIEATPLMRYALGDVISISTRPCSCCGWRGISFKILGRADDMLIVKGVNVYPAAIRTVVASLTPRTTGQIRIQLDQPGHKVTPPLRLVVEHGEGVSEDQLPALKTELEALLHDQVKVRPDIRLVAPGSLARTHHKTKIIEVLAQD
ncbi:phenylacetate--CoA ligase family protein [Variovorax sp. PBL-E5]|uniref:phenylacetate--CoA ligase family protein n=1 Tax=Variovorax sp. PBL-E5 TaxID=434014 RepID=UPI0013162349|nr:AMP-binding protein [Variovorax sp. PBL-E5]VTU39235.1 Phenylacetate-coenzyme A ligase [Variovorax sp. PBL-E5]